MIPLKDNVDLECYLVTKHSWKGKYKRILSVGSAGISTYNPEKFEVTNRWSYSDIISIAPSKNSSAYKYHWSGISLPTVLEVTACSLNQLDPTSNQLLTSYYFKDIEGLIDG
uniref:DnaJ homologue subfamily C GRV2/DNAJC13 N-terminal domain-containing protein n=1 Tax=Megaselia scalaris TaxID=36166 RepID=T1GPV5_MEGSC